MSADEGRIRDRLLERRQTLAGLAARRGETRLAELLQQVDAALEALDDGHYGECAVCHGELSAAELEADPLATVCLDCLSVDERRSLERDLEAAARVQRALLPPRRLVHDGWEVAYLWEPRGVVSGDHVDVVRPEGAERPLAVLLGDVAGKGVAASLLQSHLHALARAARGNGATPQELLARINRLFLHATEAASYATLVVAELDPDGRLCLANAGHPRPLLADGRGVRPVEGAGLPVGLFGGADFAQRELRLAPGETLVLYSDGWTEASRGDEEYGVGRAAAALRHFQALAPEELVAALRQDLAGFLDGAPPGDDLTLLALHRAR